jgi:hypothetical protein
MTRKYPFAWTLTAVFNISAAFYLVTFFFPVYVGAACLLVAMTCALIGGGMAIRRVFDFGSRHAAEFVAGAPRNPLMIDAEYASIVREIEKARAKHAPRKHLYAKRDARLAQMLGASE